MKKTIIYSLLGILGLLLSCRKTPEVSTENMWQFNMAHALLNGENWKVTGLASTRSCPEGTIDIQIGNVSKEGFPRDFLTIQSIPKTIGKYFVKTVETNRKLLKPHAGLSQLADDGDVVAAFFELNDNDTTNTVSFTAINAEQTLFEGTFNLTFYKLKKLTDTSLHLPDTIRLSQGTFKLGLHN